MGLFGFLGGASPAALPPSALPSGVYDPSQASGGDKLMMAGAMMRDIGGQLRGSDSNDIMAMQQLLAQRQLMAARNAFLMRHMGGAAAGTAAGAGGGSPGGGAAGGGGAPISADEQLIGSNALGLKFDDYNASLKNNAPFYEQGVRVNGPYDPKAPNFIPKAQDGVQPIFKDGKFVGVDAQPGATATAEALANATGMGQEGAKAFYRTDQIPTSGGSMENVPGDLANAYLRDRFLRKYGVPGSGAVVPQAGGASAAPGVGGGASTPGYSATPAGAGTGADTGELGRTPTDAEKTLATARATTQGEREKLLPQQESALQDVRRTSNLTSQIIHNILGDVQDPKTGRYQIGAKPQARWGTTGLPGAIGRHLPGSDAYDLDQQLDHIRAMTSMEELQKLRDNSPTGAGLGRVTQQEIDLLAAMRGSIDQGQSNPQFTSNLRRQLQQLEQIQATRERLYQQQFSGVPQPAAGATQPVVPRMSGGGGGGQRGGGNAGYKVLGVRRGGQ